jgi:hypothetical protein
MRWSLSTFVRVRVVKALAVAKECAVIDATLVERLSLQPEHESVQHMKKFPVGWTLLKYLSLIVGSARMGLESVVDDFLIHLLVALGYNEGDLVILSDNTLRSQQSSGASVRQRTQRADVYCVHVVGVCVLAPRTNSNLR